MKTLEELRAIYQRAKAIAVLEEDARAEESAAAIKSMAEHFAEIYDLQTTILKRAKCLRMRESFEAMAEIIVRYGLRDNRVRAFFGIIASSASAPSYRDVMGGKATIARPEPAPEPAPAVPADPLDEAAWLGDPDGASAQPAAPAVPTEPVEPVLPDPPVLPAEPELPEPVIPEGEGEPAEPELPAETDPAAASFEPDSLADFIGQTHVVKRIMAEINAAKKQGLRHIDHILLFGNRGLGKSTLMKLIAKELGVKCELMDASQFGNDVRSQRAVQKFLQRISIENAPVVIAIDEIHALPKHIQTGLLTLLNDRVYSYLDESGQTHNLPIDDFTFIGATTDAQDILPTLKDRCNNLTFYLRDYTRDELKRIFLCKFTAKGLRVTDDVLFECINRCRSSIREVDAFVKGLKTKAINASTSDVTLEMVEEYFTDTDRDPIGLKAKDLEILRAILEEPAGVISEDTLSARVHLDNKVLTKEFEPYLIKIGFISINSRGRSLSAKAIEYLKHGYFDFGGGITIGQPSVPEQTENEPPMSDGDPSETPSAPTDDAAGTGGEA